MAEQHSDQLNFVLGVSWEFSVSLLEQKAVYFMWLRLHTVYTACPAGVLVSVKSILFDPVNM